jgi:ClpP class serine protease
MSFAQVDAIAQGRVWTGADAIKIGLVDKIGGLHVAIQEAARLAVMLPNPRYFGRHLDSNYLNRRAALIMQRMNSADLP